MKSVLITGCDSGLGLSLCKELVKRSFFVIACCRSKIGIEKIEKSLEIREFDGECANEPKELTPKCGSKGISILLDTTSDVSVENAIKLVSLGIKDGWIPNLYAVVNNAGVWRFSSLQESCMSAESRSEELERWKLVLDTNVMGTVRVTLGFLPMLKASQGSRILFVSSVLDRVAMPGQSSYISSKYAVRGFHEALLHDLLHSGVESIIISPGAIRDTRLFDYDFSLPDDSLGFKKSLKILKGYGSSCRAIVKVMVEALTAKTPRNEYRCSPLFRLIDYFPKRAYIHITHHVLRWLHRAHHLLG